MHEEWLSFLANIAIIPPLPRQARMLGRGGISWVDNVREGEAGVNGEEKMERGHRMMKYLVSQEPRARSIPAWAEGLGLGLKPNTEG